MSNKRPSLQDREQNAVNHARPLGALFGAPVVDVQQEPEVKSKPDPEPEAPVEKEVEAPKLAKEPKKESTSNKKSNKPAAKGLIRTTYHMEPVIVEAIRIMDFESRAGISTIINEFLHNSIDEDILKQAERNLRRRKK